MGETYIKVKGVWKYLYSAVDKKGKTVDFLLTATCDKAPADRFFEKAMSHNGNPEIVTMDKSGANNEINHDRAVELRQIKYLNKIVEQDHRAIKRVTKPLLNFKFFRSARKVLAGIELMHLIRKVQIIVAEGNKMVFAEKFYALAR